RNFLYTAERERGLDCTEDLASPGVFEWDLSSSEAIWVLSTDRDLPAQIKTKGSLSNWFTDAQSRERARRGNFASPQLRAADAYLVDGRHGRTIIAGYPWFTAWGRDTFISLRGLCLATGRLDDAKKILLAWTDSVSQGMLPNRFPDQGGQPEYNSVDASLWYIIAVLDYLRAMKAAGRK